MEHFKNFANKINTIAHPFDPYPDSKNLYQSIKKKKLILILAEPHIKVCTLPERYIFLHWFTNHVSKWYKLTQSH